jgi:hypothetical protein
LKSLATVVAVILTFLSDFGEVLTKFFFFIPSYFSNQPVDFKPLVGLN